MGQLTTVERLKAAARIPAGVTMHDVRLGQIVSETEGQLLAELGFTTAEPATYSDRLDTMKGHDSIWTSRFPVYAVAAFTLDSVAQAQDVDYRWDSSGRLQLLETEYTTTRGGARVTYTAGLVAVAGTTQESLIRLATLRALRAWNQEPLAGLEEQSVSPIRKTVARSTTDDDAILAEIQRLMAPYVRT